MLAFAFYLLKVIICSGILLGYYWLFLRNKIFHQYNRFYLLSAILLAILLPLIQINIWHAGEQDTAAIKLLQAVNSSDEYLDEIIVTARRNNFTLEQALTIFYGTTTLIFFSLFLHAIIRIRLLFTRHQHRVIENIFLVNTTVKGTPFSFLKVIFWNDHIDTESSTGKKIFRHELAHVQQRHSYDKLFMNCVMIFFWCNPFFWLARRELNMIHEFVADKIAVEDSDTQAFAEMILQATYPQHRFQLANPFFYSPIKRRLTMLTKTRHSKVGYIGRILVLPLTIFIFAAFTFKAKTLHSYSVYEGKKMIVVIDAGHGGHDHGAVGVNGKILEKDLTLAIIKKIKAINYNSNLHIILTRESDLYQSPQEKVDFSASKHADLFISIHADANTRANASGFSVSVSKDKFGNAASSKLLASALINEFSNGYGLPVSPQPIQREVAIKVLQSSSCPAALIEAGNMQNEKDLHYLQSGRGIETIAQKVLSAIEKYATTTTAENASIIHTEDVKDTVPTVHLNKYENALIIIDGKNSTKKQMELINPDQIKSINVLKGTASLQKYGEKGKNGVILITTSKGNASTTKKDVTIRKVYFADSTKNKDKDGAVLSRGLQTEIQPLYVLDGEVKPSSFHIESIIPDDIESIHVLKGKNATKKYGENAVNGVVEIITKNKTLLKETTTPHTDQPEL